MGVAVSYMFRPRKHLEIHLQNQCTLIVSSNRWNLYDHRNSAKSNKLTYISHCLEAQYHLTSVIASFKHPITADVTTGSKLAVNAVLKQSGIDPVRHEILGLTIGTTVR